MKAWVQNNKNIKKAARGAKKKIKHSSDVYKKEKQGKFKEIYVIVCLWGAQRRLLINGITYGLMMPLL